MALRAGPDVDWPGRRIGDRPARVTGMNHASTTSDGARHIEAFIDALAQRHRRLARLTLLTRAALVVALIWVAAFGAWFLVARESTAAQTTARGRGAGGLGRRRGAGVAAAGPSADAGTPGATGRRPRVRPRRSARHGSRRARTAVAGRRWAPYAAAARRHRAARDRGRPRVGRAVGRVARRDVPGRGRDRRACRARVCRPRAGGSCRPRGPAVGVSGTACARGEPR